MIVLDASAVVEFLLGSDAGKRVHGRLIRAGGTAHAPHLVDVEVASSLRRLVRLGQMTSARAKAALDDLGDLSLHRYPHTLLMPGIWALRDNASAYDAAYLALAEVLRAPLLTRDARLAGIPGHAAKVELI